MAILQFSNCFYLSIVITAVLGRMLKMEHYGSLVFYLHFENTKYTWEWAGETCRDRNSVIARGPLPDVVLEVFKREGYLNDEAGVVWVTNQQGECVTLKLECERSRSTALGSSFCEETSWKSVVVDCSSRRRYVICQAEIQQPTTATTRRSTTRSTTSSTPSTTSTTTTSTSTTTTPTTTTATTVQSSKSTIIQSSTTNPAVMSVSTEPDIKNGEGGSASGANSTKSITSLDCRNMFSVGCARNFLVGLSYGNMDLLGLIVAVVCGVFLITALCAVICCACHSTSSESRQKRKYELVHGYSSNPMGGNPPLAGHRTDTTDETSLDASSDGRSRSLRRDEYYGSMIYPTILPPPPLLDSTSEQYQPQHSYRYQQHERGFHTLQTRHPIHAVDNNIYATINRYKKPTHTSVLDTLPPPPSPPPPPPHQTARAQLSDDDVASRGLSQCSVAGCSQSNSGGQGTITSRKSNSSNKRRSSRRQSPTPSRSSRKSSHRRKSSKGQSLELISTNL